MDINAMVQDLLGKIMQDDSLKAKFMANPINAVESLIGMDLPDDQLKAVADGILAKIGAEGAGDALNKLKSLF